MEGRGVGSVVEPEALFLAGARAGARAVVKGAAPAPALQLKLQLLPYCTFKEKK